MTRIPGRGRQGRGSRPAQTWPRAPAALPARVRSHSRSLARTHKTRSHCRRLPVGGAGPHGIRHKPPRPPPRSPESSKAAHSLACAASVAGHLRGQQAEKAQGRTGGIARMSHDTTSPPRRVARRGSVPWHRTALLGADPPRSSLPSMIGSCTISTPGWEGAAGCTV